MSPLGLKILCGAVRSRGWEPGLMIVNAASCKRLLKRPVFCVGGVTARRPKKSCGLPHQLLHVPFSSTFLYTLFKLLPITEVRGEMRPVTQKPPSLPNAWQGLCGCVQCFSCQQQHVSRLTTWWSLKLFTRFPETYTLKAWHAATYQPPALEFSWCIARTSLAWLCLFDFSVETSKPRLFCERPDGHLGRISFACASRTGWPSECFEARLFEVFKNKEG